MNWEERPNKAEARLASLSHIKLPLMNSVWLAGEKICCVTLAKEMGLFTPESHITIIERDCETYKRILQNPKLADLPNVVVVNKDISDVTINDPIDFGFFDFNGNLEKSFIEWLNKLNFSNGASSVITVSRARRNNQYLKQLYKKFQETKDIDNMIAHNQIFQKDKDVALFEIILRAAVGDRYESNFGETLWYLDTIPMLAFKLLNFQKRQEVKSVFFSSLAIDDVLPKEDVMPKKAISREQMLSNRAKKAWETRKKNEAVPAATPSLSERAKKAWVTRRKMKAARQKMLSNRAKKAWATRRLQQA